MGTLLRRRIVLFQTEFAALEVNQLAAFLIEMLSLPISKPSGLCKNSIIIKELNNSLKVLTGATI